MWDNSSYNELFDLVLAAGGLIFILKNEEWLQ